VSTWYRFRGGTLTHYLKVAGVDQVPQRKRANQVPALILGAPDPPLGDGVVTLRPPDERDLQAIDLGLHDPEVVRWFGHPESSAAEVLALNRKRWAEGSPTFCVCEPGGSCVGHVWVNVQTDDATTGSVGYWLLPTARGRGLATRSVRLIWQWAFRDLGLARLRLLTELTNERSQRVAERSGFQRIGILADHGVIDGRSIDHVLYELRRERV
jgi:[ribosomal protein S5]-alanine N-acetyltransferase